MSKRKIDTVIFDLDNTLFDWVEQWYQSFSVMLDVLQAQSTLPRETLIKEIKAIHEQHGTSEYAFLIEEIPSLRALHPGENLTVIYRAAIDSYRDARRRYLKLYPGVLPTLSLLKSKGVALIGYTESMAYYTNYRIRKLGLDGLIDVLYSPEDHDLPSGMTAELIRLYPVENYPLKATIHKYTPKGVLKPNSEVLRRILDDSQVDYDNCIYVGDSIMKDIAMANEAGITSIHARYGEAHKRKSYDLLREVTHWSKENVEREQKGETSQTIPGHVLNASFSELLSLFAYGGREDIRIETVASV